MVNGPEQIGQSGSGVNPFGGVNNDKLAQAQERLAAAKKNNPALQNIFGGGAIAFNPSASQGGSIFGMK